MEEEVASLLAQKAKLQAQLDEDAETNAQQIAKITELTVRVSNALWGENRILFHLAQYLCAVLCHLSFLSLVRSLSWSKDVAAADAEELDALEAQCMELAAELKDKEDKLKQVTHLYLSCLVALSRFISHPPVKRCITSQIQEMERKCSREYIAYEKAKLKAVKAKQVDRKDFGKFG
jgi:hypothetical protein